MLHSPKSSIWSCFWMNSKKPRCILLQAIAEISSLEHPSMFAIVALEITHKHFIFWSGHIKKMFDINLVQFHPLLISQVQTILATIKSTFKMVFENCYGDSDVSDFKLVTICGCWWLNFDVGDIFWMLVLDANVQR